MDKPDLALYPGSNEYGFVLWHSLPGTVVIELALFAVGVWLIIGWAWAVDRQRRSV